MNTITGASLLSTLTDAYSTVGYRLPKARAFAAEYLADLKATSEGTTWIFNAPGEAFAIRHVGADAFEIIKETKETK